MTTQNVECLNQILLFILGAGGKFISVLVAAGIGAHIAFKYREHEDEKKRRAARINALRIAQGAVISQLRALAGHQADFKEHDLTSRVRPNLTMIITSHVVLYVDVPSIAFLFEGDDADLIQDIQLAEGAYRSVQSALSRREALANKLLMEGKRSAVDTNAKVVRTDIDIVEAELFFSLSETTLKSIEDGIMQCEHVIQRLRAVGKKLFPGEKFLVLDPRTTRTP